MGGIPEAAGEGAEAIGWREGWEAALRSGSDVQDLSDDQTEFMIQDRLSFMRFLGLGLSDGVPDAKTIWLFREHVAQARAIKAGKLPDAWKDEPAKLRQKDRDARWTVKFSKARWPRKASRSSSILRCRLSAMRNHAAIDRRHGFIRGWAVSNAAAYDGPNSRASSGATPARRSGPIPPTGQRRTKPGCRNTAMSPISTARSRRGGR